MKQRKPSVSKTIFLLLGFIYTLFYLLSCLTPFVNPCRLSLLTYVSLLFPFLFIGCILLIIPLSVFFLHNKGWLSILLLLPAWFNLSATVSFHLPTKFHQSKNKNQIRVLSWNVDAFLYRPYQGPQYPEKQTDMINFIKEMKADILCFQDFAETPLKYGKVNIKYLADSLGYPYHFFSEDGTNYGTIMFSKFPITDSGRIKYTGLIYPESLAYININTGTDSLRIYNTHLRSMYLHNKKITPSNIGYLEFVKEDTALLFHSTRLQRLDYFNCIHVSQAEIIKEKLNNTKMPFVFCGDLNSVPSSYVYHQLQKGLKDAFLAVGSGIGRSYYKFSPSLRIDVVFTSPLLYPVQYYSPKLSLSDHYPIVTDIQFLQ